MQIEVLFVNPSELNQSYFSITPERFDFIDMELASDKLIFTVMNTEMFVIVPLLSLVGYKGISLASNPSFFQLC